MVSAADCDAQVFDLAQNKAEPLSAQKVVGKAALTRLAFNAHHPILLVGDDKWVHHPLSLWTHLKEDLHALQDYTLHFRSVQSLHAARIYITICWTVGQTSTLQVWDCRGCIHCLKLSPNLRRIANNAGNHDCGAARLDAIIDVALKSSVSDMDEGE